MPDNFINASQVLIRLSILVHLERVLVYLIDTNHNKHFRKFLSKIQTVLREPIYKRVNICIILFVIIA